MESARPEDKKGDLPYAVVILGPTGSGKTAVSLEIAQRLNQLNSSQGSSPCLDAPTPTPSTQRFRPADSPTLSARRPRSADNSSPYLGVEIISADSRAIYQGMDIGTAKPTPAEQKQVPHWGLDLVQPGERFTVADWKNYAETKIREIARRGNLPLVVGGTGLYIDALIYDYSFTKSAQKNYTDRQNLRTNFLTIGVSISREDLRKNLRQRFPQFGVNCADIFQDAADLHDGQAFPVYNQITCHRIRHGLTILVGYWATDRRIPRRNRLP